MKRGRKAYTGSALDRSVRLGIGLQHGSAQIADVLVDGRRLGEIGESLRTPKQFETRPETKFREVFACAAATVRLGLTRVEIETIRPDGTKRERPDLFMRHGVDKCGVEVSRVEPTHHEHDLVMNLQREILEAVALDASLRPDERIVTLRMTASAVRGLSASDRRDIKAEILAMLRSRRFLMLPSYSGMKSVFTNGSIAQRAGMTVSVEDVSARSSGFGLQVLLEQDARSDSLIQPICEKIDEKRESAREDGYDRTHPLWLIVEVSDQTGTFDESIAAIPKVVMDIEPFVQVVISDGRTHSVVRSDRGGNRGGSILA